ncbi:molybdate ABC transporter substrate-binding protein [Ornithinimicrobium cryptoxanthini]|uniref:Molybdate ABC transporter substrate-binding protein n=1 Tax=Ornithinimicrobium cryptoxanthini TaxID=2934161 RepID=A0ABY4YK22_9MICO|nr:molybdate ABC transporter substrate-binding protein [Ornithinimicrobium cryptoxanthini]USQ76896.1 molybdate ABC transporter substrate-binding protein [Ornithinimicrobium cryptoxanthini]
MSSHSRPSPRGLPAVAGLVILAGALGGCGGAEGVEGADVRVFAAASLTDVFTELGQQFESERGTTVEFNFAGSSGLAQQIVEGAPADVLAAASPAAMAQVTDEGRGSGAPTTFARNRLMIAVPAGNPAGVSGLEDLTDEDLTIALCAQEVPCGAASARVFEAAGLVPAPDTFERDVRAALTKVELGEVDAALVYHTDVLAAGDVVEGIGLPEPSEGVNDYPIVLLAGAFNPGGAQEFIDFVLSDTGRATLAEAGFDLP